MRKLHSELLDYSPPIKFLTLLGSIRDQSSTDSAWPFRRSPMSSLGQELLPAEVDERHRLLRLSEAEKTKALVKIIKNDELELLDTPRGFLLTGPPGSAQCASVQISSY